MTLRRRKRICAEGFRWGRLALGGMITVSSLIGCNTIMGTGAPEAERNERIRSLERDLKEKQSVIETLRERNLVLERRDRTRSQLSVTPESVPVPFAPSAANSRIEAPAPNPLKIVIPVPAAPAKTSGEQYLYSKVLETYRRRDSAEMQKALSLMLKTYRDSVHADNALYLAGLLAFEKNDTAEASRHMQRILREYPGGNKAVSALLTEALIRKKNRSLGEAKRLLGQVQKRFPGSPEAARAKAELKSIEKMAGQRREM